MKNTFKKLTQLRLKEMLEYNQKTGEFLWKKKPNKRIVVGGVAGRVITHGYKGITIDGVSYLAHRLAFFYMTGETPNEIDHINHDRADNRWSNLRESTRLKNSRHLRLDRRNKSGCNGVTWDKKRKDWYVRINARQGMKALNLGHHKDFSTAIAIRKSAEKWFWYA